MSGTSYIPGRIFCALVLFVTVVTVEAAAQEPHHTATLPLPDPTPEEMAASEWPADRPLSNSVRAWHYNPGLVKPLLDIGGAVEEPALSFAVRRMLAAVVASRNNCLY